MNLRYFSESFEKDPAKVILNVFALVVSVFFLTKLFSEIMSIGVFVAIFTELLGQYSLASGKYFWRRGKKLIALFVFVPYAGYAAAIMVATMVLSMSQIGGAASVANTIEVQRQTIIDTIAAEKVNLKSLQAQRSEITNYPVSERSWRYTSANNRINKVEAHIAELNASLDSYHVETANIQVNGLDALGRVFDRDNPHAGDAIKVVMFAFIGLFLIVGLIMTSWDLPEKVEATKQTEKPRQVISKDTELTLRYIEALDFNAKRFQGDGIVSDILGVDQWQVRRIRESLKHIPVRCPDGTVHNLIEGGNGASNSIFTREQMKEVITKISGGEK